MASVLEKGSNAMQAIPATGSLGVMRMLRAVAVAGFRKIHKNRFKDVPGTEKWDPASIDPLLGRTWVATNLDFLHEKLDEETGELIEASNDVSLDEGAYSKEDVLDEAGDVTNLAMMIADRCHAIPGVVDVPKVVTLCGSTRFKEQFEAANFAETMNGNIVLSVGFFHHQSDYPLSVHEKAVLDRLHFAKIDLSDEILVINVGGYVGESTRNEIEYARRTGKLVRFLEVPTDGSD